MRAATPRSTDGDDDEEGPVELLVTAPRPPRWGTQTRRAAGRMRPRTVHDRDDEHRFASLLGFDPKLTAEDELVHAAAHAERPLTRGDCKGGPRPCPWVGCTQHLYLDVTPNGAIKLNHPGVAPWQLAESCALDVADRGEQLLEDVGRLLNLSRERVRQIEVSGLHKLGCEAPDHDLDAAAMDLFPHPEAA